MAEGGGGKVLAEKKKKKEVNFPLHVKLNCLKVLLVPLSLSPEESCFNEY